MEFSNFIHGLALREELLIQKIARRSRLSSSVIDRYLMSARVGLKLALLDRSNKPDLFADKLSI